MCILFVLVGGLGRPSVLLSNRDEYFDRPTRRGYFDISAGTYAPTDLEGGGTWLSAKGIDGMFRYSVVLNNDIWREVGCNVLGQTTLTGPLKSKGLLVNGFVKQNMSAKDYALEIYKNRKEYRPFNLIVCDGCRTYYVSSNNVQVGPELLLEGKWYSFTNGYITSDWDKTFLGLYLIRKFIKDYTRHEPSIGEATHFALEDTIMEAKTNADSSDSNCEVDNQFLNLINSCDSGPVVSALAQNLLDIMLVDTPLPEPTFGTHSAAAMQLYGIFVKPTLVIRNAWYAGFLALYMMLSELLYTLLSLLFSLEIIQKVIGTSNGPNNKIITSTSSYDYSDVLGFLRYYIFRALELGPILFCSPNDVTSNNGINNCISSDNSCCNKSSSMIIPRPHYPDIFGTRTTTVIIHIPKPSQITITTTEATNEKSSVLNMNDNKLENLDPFNPSIDSSVTSSAAIAASYYILESDLDTTTMKWST